MEKDKTRPVYIIGHKNPDTDSICSALAYAYLKNHLEGGGYIAARAGQLNQETQYVLNFFQAEAPVYVADVMTQVKDIEIRKTAGVRGNLVGQNHLRVARQSSRNGNGRGILCGSFG